MPTRISPDAKLSGIGRQEKSAFQKRIPWGRVLKALKVAHETELDEEGFALKCPYCESVGEETFISLSDDAKVFNCVNCDTTEGKLAFVSSNFLSEPTVAEVMRLFGNDCFNPL